MSKAIPTLTSAKQNQLTVKIPTQDLIKIVEGASNFGDRLSENFVVKDSKIVDRRLEKWCQVVSKGDRQKFLKRLDWDNLNINSVRQILGNANLVDRESLPSWTDTLRRAMEIAATVSDTIFTDTKYKKYQYLDVENPLPFEEVYLSFIEVAKEKIAAKTGLNFDLISDTAYHQLQSSLLVQLTNLFVRTLDLEFSLFRAYKGSQLIHLINKLQNSSSRKLYDEFVKNLLKDGLLSFFHEYSVLAKLAAIVTDFWVENTAEFIDRLALDWEKINQTFEENLGQVVSITTGLSDPHNCGHSVKIIQFTSDLKLVYKPKNLSLEQAYFSFLTWINQQDAVLNLKTLKIISCSTHGWIEFVEALPCPDQEAIKRYYQRAGMILCLVYALRGNDCHHENLIACGEQPVLIDLETLLHYNTWAYQKNAEAIVIAQEKLLSSVMATCLLPGANIMAQGNNIDVSGLGSIDESTPLRSLKWENINTDSMAIVEEEIKIDSTKSQPSGENLDISLSNHSEELIMGFEQMYNFLQERQELLLAPDSPLTIFTQQKIRILFRNTELYNSILQNSLHPKFLRRGIERSIELDILSRALLSSDTKPHNWAIIAAEKQALEQLDIPYITGYSDRNSIVINSKVTIDRFVENPSYDDVVLRIQELNNDNLAEQTSIIQASLYSCSSQSIENFATELDTVYYPEVGELNLENVLQQVINIAEELERKAIRGSNNSCAWLGMTYNFSWQKFQFHPLNHSLYDGHTGIALFFAALAKITGKEKYAHLAKGSLYSLRKNIWEENSELKTELTGAMDVGGAKGLASIVYSLVRIAEFIDEPKLIEEAQQIARWMKIDRANLPSQLGIFDGVAGTILSLLSLYKVTHQSETLEQATAWGKYLLDRRESIGINNQIWLNSSGEVLTGFSEGIAGISYALLSLYAANQETVFLTAAIKAIFYEQNNFSSANNIASLPGWCYGLPGIALARLGSLEVLNTDTIHLELKTIVNHIVSSPLASLDNLWCGNFAELEVLILAAKKFNNLEYLEIAKHKVAKILSRKEHLGGFQLLHSLPNGVFVPSFGLGMVGVGYGLLRYLYPEELPSVLLWQ